MKLAGLLISLLFIAAPATSAELNPRPTDSVIYLTKNTNNNQVHYGVHVDEHCRPVTDDPVYAYWRMLEKGPQETAKIALWEQPGYGVKQPKDVQRDVNSGRLQLFIRGVPEQVIELRTASTENGCSAQAFTRIAEESAQIERIDIKVSGWANVHRVEIHGLNARTGEAVSEVIHQD